MLCSVCVCVPAGGGARAAGALVKYRAAGRCGGGPEESARRESLQSTAAHLSVFINEKQNCIAIKRDTNQWEKCCAM